MARVNVKKLREQAAHFGLYRQGLGSGDIMIIRRKVGEPTDYMHTKSRKVKQQREDLALASRHYANLTPTQKGFTRHQFEEVEYQVNHGKTDTKILTGRQLFVAKEVRSLRATGKQLVIPFEVCIVLTDQDLNPLEGELWLFIWVEGEPFDLPREKLAPTDWLFSRVPPGYAPYHPLGQAEGYHDSEDPETTYLDEKALKAYHYHKLYLLGAEPTKEFECNTTCTSNIRVTLDYQPAATFKLENSIILTEANVRMAKSLTGEGKVVVAEVYQAGAQGSPAGAMIDAASADVSEISRVPVWSSVKFTFTHHKTLTAGVRYVLWLKSEYRPPQHDVLWCGQIGNVCPDTFLVYYLAGTETWLYFPDRDMSFNLWGRVLA